MVKAASSFAYTEMSLRTARRAQLSRRCGACLALIPARSMQPDPPVLRLGAEHLSQLLQFDVADRLEMLR